MSFAARRLPGVVVLTAGLLVALLLAGCGSLRGEAPSTTPPSGEATATPTSPGALSLWIAVFESAEDPNDLERAAGELMERAGTAVVVAPEGCFGGLRGRGDVRAGEYVLAVVADSKDGLDAAVDRAGREPVVTASVVDLCPA
jgi:hypothetical protein